MEATIVDLRYHMKDVLRALDRNEEVRILYRGKVKGVIKPQSGRKRVKVSDHPFFGSEKDGEPVKVLMDRLRGGRYRDL
jgi:hypothetical protein